MLKEIEKEFDKKFPKDEGWMVIIMPSKTLIKRLNQ